MFGDEGRKFPEGGPCKRDWEGEAKRVKKYLDDSEGMLVALQKFMGSESRHRAFDSYSEQMPFFAMIGGLSMMVPELRKEYDNIIKQMEQE